MFWGNKCLQNSKFEFLWKYLLIKHFQTQKWFNVIFCKFPHNAISHPHKRSEIWRLEYQSVKIQTNLSFSILKDFYIYIFHKMFFLQKKIEQIFVLPYEARRNRLRRPPCRGTSGSSPCRNWGRNTFRVQLKQIYIFTGKDIARPSYEKIEKLSRAISFKTFRNIFKRRIYAPILTPK